jgi:gamma-glutamyltranspeptidase/glutathione hydrolase
MSKNPVLGREHMTVTGHSAASIAALRVLDRGGSVSDAAIAAAAVLTVVLPSACSLGGDAFILVHDAGTGRTAGINASGPAPAATDPGAFAGGIPAKGGRSITVPGVVGGWAALHERFGRLAWSDLFADAIRAAAKGFPVTAALAQASRISRTELAADPGCRTLFLSAGEPLAAGAVLAQPALAATLRTIAADGAASFYDGKIANGIGEAVTRAGGFLRSSDLSGYRAAWVTPITTTYRGLDVRVMPPNSYGLYMLMQLNALAGHELKGVPLLSERRFAPLIAAAHAAFAVGGDFVADPRAGPPGVEQALAPAMTERLRAAMAAPIRPGPTARGGTAVVMVADRDGNAVNIVESVFTLFGSAVADPETGVVLNDRMLGFTTAPGHPNSVAPGKRPAHTLNPVAVFDGEGGLRYLMGTPGGPGQTITLTQVLSALVDSGLDPAAAVAAPRWSMERAGMPLVEPELPDAVRVGLNAAGFPVTASPPGSPFFGSAQLIERRHDGVLIGAADDRREPVALGI